MAEVITLPKMSDTMEVGTLVKWHIKIGDNISSGEVIAEVETDKATMDLEAYSEGEVLYIGAQEGDQVPVNTPLVVVGHKGEDYQALLAGIINTKSTAYQPSEAKPLPAEKASDGLHHASDENNNLGRVKASPLARKLAKENGVSLSAIPAPTNRPRIIKKDIEAALQGGGFSTQAPTMTIPPQEAAEYSDVPLTSMRRIIAERLCNSKFSAPHFYLKQRIRMDKLIALRNEIIQGTGIKISFNDFVVKAVVAALKKHPALNSSFLGDKIRYHKSINIGVAVALPEGLMVPVVNHAEKKSLLEISSEIKELARQVREKKITPAQMQGSTFTISNLGMYGISEFTSIINAPDSCILAVGAIEKVPIIEADDTIVPANMLTVVLSADHRVVDGALVAEFLTTLRDYLQQPYLITMA